MKILNYSKVILISTLFLIFAMELLALDEKPQEPLNEWCPILTDEKSEPDYTVSHEGKLVGLCCDKCKRKFLKNPQKYLDNLPQFKSSEEEEQEKKEPEIATPEVGTEEKKSSAEPEHKMLMNKEDSSEAPVQEKGHHEDNSENPGIKDDKSSSEDRTSIRQLFRFAGKFHPVVVHFPIALTITAGLSEAIFMLNKKVVFSHLARANLVVAGLSSIIAALLGWINGSFIKVSADLEWPLFLHRWLGISATLLIIFAVIASEMAERSENLQLRIGYRACLFMATFLVAVTGHFGGIMVFGADYFNW